MKWLMPSFLAHANELTVEVVDGDDPTLFAGRHFGAPAIMMHLKNYYDITPSTYLEWGVTGMAGFNNRIGFPNRSSTRLVDEPLRATVVGGADLTVSWSPVQRSKYKSLTWRTEVFGAIKQLPRTGWDTGVEFGGDPVMVATPHESVGSAGIYSYLQYQLNERWFVGARADAALPTVRNSNEPAFSFTPYATFWQSEFVYMRLEYQHGQFMPYVTPDKQIGRRMDNRLLMQIDFAAGPHKHAKY